MAEKIRVLLIDDHPMIIDGLTLALETDDIEVVAYRRHGERSATAGDRDLAVHVVVLDLHLPDGSGLSLIPFPASGGAVLPQSSCSLSPKTSGWSAVRCSPGQAAIW